MKIIRVTGLFEIEDDEFDPGPEGPLTSEAYFRYHAMFELDDAEFELVADDNPNG